MITDKPLLDADTWKAVDPALEASDKFEISAEVREKANSLIRSFLETAIRESAEFELMGLSTTEAASLVAQSMLRAAWANAASAKLESAGIPRPELFVHAAKRATEAFDFSELRTEG